MDLDDDEELSKKDKENIDSKVILEGVDYIHASRMKRYKELEDASNKIKSVKKKKEYDKLLAQLSGTIGYMAQVHGALVKSVDHEKRIKEIEERIKDPFRNMTVETIQMYLEKHEQGGLTVK